MINAVMYTDGSATIRPDGTFYCGYSYLFVVEGRAILGKAFPGMGTINQAEMCAVYKGMEDAEAHGIHITEVYTDSTYVINGLIANTEKYDTNEWTNSQGFEIVNKEMWVNLIEFTKKRGKPIPTVHVKGHTGQPFNELCDKLAKEAAMSQKPVIEYMDLDMCYELGFNIPSTVEPIPLPANYCSPTSVSGSIIDTLSAYTDDRAKCCMIDYPGMLNVIVSKGVSYWTSCEGAPTTDELRMSYNVYPVKTSDGKELPFYRYMTESGTPFNVVMNSNSEVIWQGSDFNQALFCTINDLLALPECADQDLIIASYNLASAKRFQGIYFGGYSAQNGSGSVMQVYRTERVPQGKCMRIPRGYIEKIAQYILNNKDTTIGLITSTTMLGLVITSSGGGMLVGSSVIPHTITIGDSMIINMDKPDKPNVRFTDTVQAQECLDKAYQRIVPAVSLDTLIPDQGYIKPEHSGHVQDCNDTPMVTVLEETTNSEHECSTKRIIDSMIDMNNSIINLLNQQQHMLLELSKLNDSYSAMSRDKLAEIESKVRSDMLRKFNDMFK